jgi:type I restriction enzyme S subunit
MSEQDATLDEFTEGESGENKKKVGPPTEITNLPEGWGAVRLDDVANDKEGAFVDGPFGSNLKADEMVEQGYARIIQLQNIRDSEFVDTNHKYVSHEKFKELERHGAEPGDIAIAKMSEPVARACLLPEIEEQYLVVADCIKLSVDESKYNSLFVMLALNSEPVWKQAFARSRGSTRKRINLTQLKEVQIPSPSLDEQRKIASVLDTVDQAIQKTEEIISKIKTVRKGTVHNLFEGEDLEDRRNKQSPNEDQVNEILNSRREVWAESQKERQQRAGNYEGKIDESKYESPLDIATQRLPKLPEGWTWISLDTVVAYDIDYRGKTPPYSESGIPVISSGNIQNGEIVFNEKRYVSEDTYGEWLDRGVPKEGDLLITTEAPVGKVALYPEGTYLPTRRIITFRTVGVDNRYLQAAIHHPYVQNYLTAQSGGSTVGRILKDHLLKTPIPLPPTEEQNQIAEALREFDRKIANEKEYKIQLQRLKQGLMQDILSGEVRTHDKDIEIVDDVLQYG